MSRRFEKHYPGAGIIKLPGVGIVFDSGPTVPADASIGYAPGCIFIDSDASGVAAWFRNDGTAASADFNVFAGGLDLSTLVTTVTELNLLSGLLAAAAEINRAADLSTRIVNVTASTLALTLADHDGKTVTINAAAGCAVTLPAATGTGARFRIFIGTTITSNATTFTRAGSDTIFGFLYQLADGGSTLAAYELPGSTVISLNGSTTGGIKGDWLEFEDVAAATWAAVVHTSATGSEGTPIT